MARNYTRSVNTQTIIFSMFSVLVNLCLSTKIEVDCGVPAQR